MEIAEEKQPAQAAPSPQKPESGESTESKPRRGGRRPGAGRKPNLAKQILKGYNRNTISNALADVDVAKVIRDLLASKKDIIKLQTLEFISDRLFGKPKQEIGVSGGLMHAHVRDPRLAALPKEALEELARTYDRVLVKYLPVSTASQDGPQDQIESNTATEAVEVEADRDVGTRGRKTSRFESGTPKFVRIGGISSFYSLAFTCGKALVLNNLHT